MCIHGCLRGLKSSRWAKDEEDGGGLKRWVDDVTAELGQPPKAHIHVQSSVSILEALLTSQDSDIFAQSKGT